MGAILRFVMPVLAALWLSSTSAQADARLETAKSLVSDMAIAVKEAVEADYADEATRLAAVNDLLDRYFDFEGITRFSAGRYWRAATEAEKADYTHLFRTVLTGLAARQFDQLKGLDYTVTNAVSKGDRLVLVTGTMSDPSGNNPDAIVSWRVATPADKEQRIIDVEIENISMLITQQQENTAIIRKNGGQFSALIDVLKKSAQDL